MYHFVQCLQVPFLKHFSLIMTLILAMVDPCLDNIFMVLLVSALATIGVTKPIFFWILVPHGREGGLCMRGHGLLSLYSSYTKFK